MIHSQTHVQKKLTLVEQGVREGLTEILARRKVKELTDVDVAIGSYNKLFLALNKISLNQKDSLLLNCLSSKEILDDFCNLTKVKKDETKNIISSLFK